MYVQPHFGKALELIDNFMNQPNAGLSMPLCLSGRVDIEVIVDIPQHTELVELPQEGCIWRQARGAAAEISGVEREAVSEKVHTLHAFLQFFTISHA